jgi:hypothetical protein
MGDIHGEGNRHFFFATTLRTLKKKQFLSIDIELGPSE